MTRTIAAPNYAVTALVNGFEQDVIVIKDITENNTQEVILWDALSDFDRQVVIDLLDDYGIDAAGSFPLNTPVAGWQEINYNNEITTNDLTGLRDDDTTYIITVRVSDSLGDNDVTIQVVGSNVQTFGDLVSELNAHFVDASVSIVNGNIRISHNTAGTFNDVKIVKDYLFANTSRFSGYNVPRKGASDVTDIFYRNLNNAGVPFEKSFGKTIIPQRSIIIMNRENDTDASTTGEWFTIPRNPGRDEILVQVTIDSGTASVQLQGRISANSPAYDILQSPTSSSLLQPIAYVPQIRAVTSGVSGTPNVKVEIGC